MNLHPMMTARCKGLFVGCNYCYILFWLLPLAPKLTVQPPGKPR
jgi:hypothetical protein